MKSLTITKSEKAYALYEQGMTLRQIGNIMGVSTQYAHKLVQAGKYIGVGKFTLYSRKKAYCSTVICCSCNHEIVTPNPEQLRYCQWCGAKFRDDRRQSADI